MNVIKCLLLDHSGHRQTGGAPSICGGGSAVCGGPGGGTPGSQSQTQTGGGQTGALSEWLELVFHGNVIVIVFYTFIIIQAKYMFSNFTSSLINNIEFSNYHGGVIIMLRHIDYNIGIADE